MQYLKVNWKHDFADDPVLLVSELDDERMEQRKVEVYRDGRADIADVNMATGSTRLSIEPIPTEQEIESDEQFVVETISGQEFEQLWKQSMRAHA